MRAPLERVNTGAACQSTSTSERQPVSRRSFARRRSNQREGRAAQSWPASVTLEPAVPVTAPAAPVAPAGPLPATPPHVPRRCRPDHRPRRGRFPPRRLRVRRPRPGRFRRRRLRVRRDSRQGRCPPPQIRRVRPGRHQRPPCYQRRPRPRLPRLRQRRPPRPPCQPPAHRRPPRRACSRSDRRTGTSNRRRNRQPKPQRGDDQPDERTTHAIRVNHLVAVRHRQNETGAPANGDACWLRPARRGGYRLQAPVPTVCGQCVVGLGALPPAPPAPLVFPSTPQQRW